MTSLTLNEIGPVAGNGAAEARWHLDEAESEAEFTARGMWGLATVAGRFKGVAGTVSGIEGLGGRGELVIDTATIDTGNHRRDKHLRSADFFDAERHPSMRFAGEFDPGVRGTTKITGVLVRGDATTPVEVAAKVDGDGERLVLEGETVLDRRKLGIVGGPPGMIRPAVRVRVKAVLRRTAV